MTKKLTYAEALKMADNDPQKAAELMRDDATKRMNATASYVTEQGVPDNSEDEGGNSGEPANHEADITPFVHSTYEPPAEEVDDDELDVTESKPKFAHNVFGDEMIEHLHMRFIDGSPAVWVDGRYETGYKAVKRSMTVKWRGIRQSQRNEVYSYLEDVASRVDDDNKHLIQFKNCTVDVRTLETMPNSPDFNIPVTIDHDYVPGCRDQRLDDAVGAWSCGRADVATMLYEVIGLCMYRDSGRYAAGYIMENGTASNGKSTYLRLLRNVLGNDTISRLNPQQLGGRFSGSDLEGKLAVVADDVPADVVDGASSQVFKCLCTGDPISAEVKCGPRYGFTPKATVVFSCNTMPRFKGIDNGILRRIVPLPLNARFSGSNDDPKVKADLVGDEQVIEYAISRGVQALHGIIERGHVTKCEEHDNLVKAIETESNSALAYLEVAELEGRQIEGRPTSEVYGAYKIFCSNFGLTRPFSLTGFTKELKKSGWDVKIDKLFDANLGKRVSKRCYTRL